MALEKRGENYYYYKKEREGNRVVSTYYGKGELASIFAQMAEIDRESKRYETLQNLTFKQEIEAIDRDIETYESKVREITPDALLSLRHEAIPMPTVETAIAGPKAR